MVVGHEVLVQSSHRWQYDDSGEVYGWKGQHVVYYCGQVDNPRRRTTVTANSFENGPKLYTSFVLVDSELRSRRNRTFDGTAALLDQKMSFAIRLPRGSREGKRTNLLLHLARDEKERASSIDEQRIDGALGIALFFSPFLSASSDPFTSQPQATAWTHHYSFTIAA
ncbi:hypothetical protein KSP39_PZI021988 [Platanthera zijinensis]|uniref:Uncharacterized protein n=1 Tax=Platanthera zijinensis TaxID=2320716 RepID=A0AAP0AWT9_9ASPA